MKLVFRIRRSIARRKGSVVLTRDFSGFGSKAAVAKALRELVGSNVLCRLGYGVYGKLRFVEHLGRYALQRPFEGMAEEALRRLGVSCDPGRAQRAYLEGKTNQIPMTVAFEVGTRIRRKLGLGELKVSYERNRSHGTRHDRGLQP